MASTLRSVAFAVLALLSLGAPGAQGASEKSVLLIGGTLVINDANGSRRYQLDEGIAAYKRKDYAAALKIYRAFAENGHAGAMNEVGWMHATGDGVAKSDVVAFGWFLNAAKAGHVAAQYTVASRYMQGVGTAQNDMEALRWIKVAADRGHAKAQYNMGFAHAQGMQVEKDFGKAARYYRLSADQGWHRR